MNLKQLVLLLSLIGMCTSGNGQTNELRAFWADAWHRGFMDAGQAKKLVSDVRKANCNAIFVQVRKRGDAYYLGSPYEPVGKGVAKDFDPLAEIIKLAHDPTKGERIEVHAWMVMYPVNYKRKFKSKPEPVLAYTAPEHPFNRHPEWLSKSTRGATYNGQDYFLDPGHPEVQQHLLNVAMDLVSRYDIDGLHLDHARYTSQFWGYNKVSVARFNMLYDRTGVPDHSDPEWSQFRRDQVTGLIRKIYLTAVEAKPELKVSASGIAWAPAITSKEQWSSSMAFRTCLQDWHGWMEEGIIDMVVPMMFFDQSKPQFGKQLVDWATFAKDNKYDRHLAIGIGGWIHSPNDVLHQIKAARNPSPQTNLADGIVIYSYAEPRKTNSVEGFQLSERQGKNPKEPMFSFLSTTVFTNSVPTPEMPWKKNVQLGHLKGFVLDSKSNAVDGAIVVAEGKTIKTNKTDASGFYGFTDLEPGEYSIRTQFKNKHTQLNAAVGSKVTTLNVIINN